MVIRLDIITEFGAMCKITVNPHHLIIYLYVLQ